MDDMVRPPQVEIDPGKVMLLLDTLLKALGTRALMFSALIMTFALFCWAMRLQSWLAFAIASAFGLGVLGPVLYIGFKGENDG